MRRVLGPSRPQRRVYSGLFSTTRATASGAQTENNEYAKDIETTIKADGEESSIKAYLHIESRVGSSRVINAAGEVQDAL